MPGRQRARFVAVRRLWPKSCWPRVGTFSWLLTLVPGLPGFDTSNQKPCLSLEQTAEAIADPVPDDTHLDIPGSALRLSGRQIWHLGL